MVIGVQSIYAQSSVVQGTVTEEGSGAPIIGATVIATSATGTIVGATTDLDGVYSIKVANGITELEFSYLGYQTVMVPIGGKSTLDVQLHSEASTLEEVVVVGYGMQKKVSVTGSVASVTSDDIKSSPSSNLAGSLTGKLPGLTITQSSGQAGSEDFSFYLRGVSTISGSSQSPLILIDGVPRSDLSMIDPNEIASVSILKDASATAVFGVRGANGVVLITTRVGDEGQPQLTFSAEYGLQSFTKDYDMIDSWDYAKLYNEAATNDGQTTNLYSDRQIQLYKDGTSALYPNTDWYDIIFKGVAPMGRYNVNLSGSTDKVNYFLNLGMLNQDGMMNTLSKEELDYNPQYSLDRYNFRANLDIKVNSWIKTSLKISGYIDDVSQSYASSNNIYNFFKQVYEMTPVTPCFYDEQMAEYGVSSDYDILVSNGITNPYGELNYRGYKQTDKLKLNNSATIDFDLSGITKGLSARALVAYDTAITSTVTGSTSSTGYNLYLFSVSEQTDANGNVYDAPSFSLQDELQEYQLSLSKGNSSYYAMNVQAMLNYSREFGKHTVGGMFVYQFDNSRTGSGSHIDLLPYNRVGYALRGTYSYDDRYMAEVNVGYNGSEQFAAGKRFGLFPAVSAGWMVSNEQFLQGNDVITSLKLRASYGLVGNDKIGSDRFLYLDNLTLSAQTTGTSNNAYSQTNASLADGYLIRENRDGNENLTWEVAEKQNYGFDLQLFKKLSITFDYFREYRDGILISTNSIPQSLGTVSSFLAALNAGIVKNHGFELDAKYFGNFTKDLSYTVGATLNFARNEVVYRDEIYMGDDYYCPKQSEGYSLNQNFGYYIDWDSIGDGYFTSQEEIDNYCPYTESTPRVGDFVYKDLNGDGEINSKDAAPLGSPSLPELNYSLSLGLGYKGFDMSVLLYGVGNNHKYFTGYGINEYTSVYQSHHMNAWTYERYENGDEISYPALSLSASSSHDRNDYFVMNCRYLRLKNVEIGYTLPKSWIKKFGMTNVRVYTNATNLLTWDSIPFEYVDPEQSSLSSVVPLQRVVNVGVNVKF